MLIILIDPCSKDDIQALEGQYVTPVCPFRLNKDTAAVCGLGYRPRTSPDFPDFLLFLPISSLVPPQRRSLACSDSRPAPPRCPLLRYRLMFCDEIISYLPRKLFNFFWPWKVARVVTKMLRSSCHCLQEFVTFWDFCDGSWFRPRRGRLLTSGERGGPGGPLEGATAISKYVLMQLRKRKLQGQNSQHTFSKVNSALD